MGDEDRARGAPASPPPAPRAGPTETRRARSVETPPAGASGREGGSRRSGKRGKGRNSRNKPLGENQTNRVRAWRAQSPGWGGVWGPGNWGRDLELKRVLRLGGSGLVGWGRRVGNPEARALRLPRALRDAAPRRESSRLGGSSALSPAQAKAPNCGGVLGRWVSVPLASLLRARRLPLRPGSFRTFRPAPSRRPPFPGPPLGSFGPGGAARPERPPELGPGPGRPAGSGPEPRETSTIASNSWNASSSPGEAREDGPEGLDKGLENDAEGVWSPDIEQSFQEALAIYPPCGRRKIILSDEGKMYGRNELIARYIKLRTGKTRTRKQVSSHLQVLARRKSREIQSKLKAMNLDQVSKDKALQSMASMSSAQIVSASVLQNKFSPPSPLPQAVFSTSSRFWSSPPLLGQQPGPSQDIKPFAQPAYPIQPPLPPTLSSYEPLTPLPPAAASVPVWQDRTIASSRLRLLEYSAFMEVQRDPDTYSKHLFVHIGQTNPAFSDPPLEAVDVRQIYDKFPEKKGGLKELYEKGPPNAFFLVKFWADLNSTIQEGPGAFYGVSSQYSSADSMTISVSTKVCSFGKQVVEKVETEYARLENGRFVYRIHRSPMCEYMINFIHKLKHLPEKYMMNSVLENFTILQVVTSRDSQETLLVIAFVFEVSTSEHGAQHHVYKLVKD
ncbi:transcriptional enhancer factor TEF-5 [Suricata suricatta]|nr:transcriptional enhancer factor TEF-5 [Suricata suricatta]